GSPGGSLRVARLLRERWGDLEGDFQRHHQVDLRTVWRRPGQRTGFLGVRRLIRLVDALPADAVVNRHGGITWGTTDELLAQLIEEVAVLAADHRRKKPREVPRPYARPSASAVTGHKAMAAAAAARGMVRHG
ncbi:MAG TPA: hypothetical protein VFP72_04545, partial [Kineosporiaceae bacterium]|nr:hypothetical protein [Kineosporiaceae bacterium]